MYSKEMEDFFQENIKGFVLYPDKIEKKFVNIDEFIDFIRAEFEYWKECTNGILGQTQVLFNSISNHLDSFKKYYTTSTTKSKENLSAAVQNSKSKAISLIYSSSSLGVQIKEYYIIDPEIANGFIYSYHNKDVNLNPRTLKGIIYQTIVNDDGILNDEYESIKNDLTELKKATIKEFDSLRITELDEHKSTIEKYKQFEKEITEWKNQVFNKWKEKYDAIEINFTTLETVFKEKLRLEGPAEYWDDYRKKHRNIGWVWFGISVLLTLGIIGLCIYLLCNMPNQLFFTVENGIEKLSLINLIKWSIIIALALSTGFYILRLAVRLTLSSFHLSRDAHERYQLTYQFLALVKEGGLNPEQRLIILQSLFSRADTGLLKGDATPAIPDSLAATVFKAIKNP